MKKDFFKMILITLVLDVFLIYILLCRFLNRMDTYLIFLFLLCHIVFLYSLIKNNEMLINILHYLLCILLFVTAFLVEDILLLMVLLFLVFMIQFLWIIENKCIMNKDGEQMFRNKWIDNGGRVVTLLLTIYLSFKIGKCMNKVVPSSFTYDDNGCEGGGGGGGGEEIINVK